MEEVIEEISFLKELREQKRFTPFQEKAWEKFEQIGLPTEKHELFRYLPLKKIYSKTPKRAFETTVSKEDVAPFIYPECRESALVFVDGEFKLSLSSLKNLPKSVMVFPKDQAMKVFANLIETADKTALAEEQDPFALLAKALFKDALFCYIPPKTVLESPLQILNVVTTSSFQTPAIQVFAGKASEVQILETMHFLQKVEPFITGFTEFHLEERARVNFYRVLNGHQGNTNHFEAIRATLKKESYFKSVSANFGAETIRDDYLVYLEGEGGEVSLNGVWLLKENLQSHTHVRIEHVAENCQSMQLFKGVLHDFSKSSFEGKIFVEKTAQKTNAFQLNNNLLLSPRAESFSKPNLEIFADDVKASHGATVGPVDEEQLFYLKTRGIPLDKAVELLVKGYCLEVMNLFPSWLKNF